MSSPKYKLQQGFTAVELIIALVIGVLLLTSAYQLYSAVVNDSGDSQRRAQASNVAYSLLRQYQNDNTFVTSPCVARTATPAVPTYANLPGATASVATTCPYTTTTALSLITVTVTINNSNQQEQVTRAVTTEAP